jgi:hypothetical protein
VSLEVTNSNGDTSIAVEANFIRQVTDVSIAAPVETGLYEKVSIFLYDSTTSCLINREQGVSNLTTFGVQYTGRLDFVGTATFRVFDDGTATAADLALIRQDVNVVIVMGKAVVFSGKIKRVSQTIQPIYEETTRIMIWNVECESDLTKLSGEVLNSSSMSGSGQPILDTPGWLAQRVLYSSDYIPDWVGYIDPNDVKIHFQLNSVNNAESSASKLSYLQNLRQLTNYDLRSRLDYERYAYTGYAATITTITGAGFTVDEFLNRYMLFVNDDYIKLSKTFTTAFATNNTRLLIGTASTFFAVDDRVALTGADLSNGLLATVLYYVKAVTTTYITLALTSGGDAVTFSDDGGGTQTANKITLSNGVYAYGVITGNTADTITCTITGGSINPVSGYVVILKDSKVDFAQDISQPSPTINYGVNKDLFSFDDKVDNKKAVSKVVATGKDSGGTTIGASISAVHKWDDEAQFFDDCTYVTQKTEGYIYDNTTIKGDYYSCVASPAHSSHCMYNTTAPTQIIMNGDTSAYKIGDMVKISSGNVSPPDGLADPSYYYVCSIIDGDKITITGALYSTTPINPLGSASISGTDYFHCEIEYGWVYVDSSINPSQVTQGLPLSFTTTTADCMGLTDTSTIYYQYTTPGGGEAYIRGYWGGARYPGACFAFKVASDFLGTTPVSVTSVGDAVYAYDPGTTPGFYVWLLGWNYNIPSGTTVSLITPYSVSYTTVTTTGAPVEETALDGTQVTKIQITKAAAILDKYYGNLGFLLGNRIYVKDHDMCGGATGTVLIGEEPVAYTAKGTSTTYGDYITVVSSGRIMSNSLKAYPHTIGCLVGQTNYTEAAPQEDSAYAAIDPDHPLQIGPLIETLTVDNNITYGDLDVYATQKLVGGSYFYRKASGTGPIFHIYYKDVGLAHNAEVPYKEYDCVRPPREGDRISITDYTGGTTTEYQIVSVDVNIDGGLVSLKLGDYDKNMVLFVNRSTEGLNSTTT